MARSKANLDAAKSAKNDEFYTRFQDIEHEVIEYWMFNKELFKGKTVLLPADDPKWSNFTKFFTHCFRDFGLKKLISTSYNPNGTGKCYVLEADSLPDRNCITPDDMQEFDWNSNGDFRTIEVRNLLKEADFVISNPPFSLFRDIIDWVMAANKQFLFIGNMNAITYKNIWPRIQSNEIWLGAHKQAAMKFYISDNCEKYHGIENDFVTQKPRKYAKISNCCWFTNIPHARRNEPKLLEKSSNILRHHRAMSGLKNFQKYDNYDAIEIPAIKSIPGDYAGVMGVPITFIDSYCPDQFEIVGFRYGNDGKDLRIGKETPYFRVLIRNRNPEQPNP